MNISKKMTDGALMTGVFIVLLMISMFIPILNIIATVALPVPFVLYAARYDLKAVGLMFVASHLLALLVGTLVSLPYAFTAALGGVLIGTAIRKKLTMYETWASGSIGFVAGLVAAFVFSQLVLDINVIDSANEMIDESLSMSENIMDSTGMLEDEEAAETLEAFKEQFQQLPDYIPVGIVAAAIFMAFVTQWLSYKVMNRIERTSYQFPPFRSLRLPTSLIWIYFLTLLVSLFMNDKDSLFNLAINNALLLAGLFMMLQGFSFIFFYADLKDISKALPVIIVIITFLIPTIMFALVRIVGIIDIGFGLRDRLTKSS